MTLEEQLKIFTRIVGEPTVCDYGDLWQLWEYEEPFDGNAKIVTHIEGRAANTGEYVFYDFFIEIRNKGRVVRLHNQSEVERWVLENKDNQTIKPERVQIAFNLLYSKFYYLTRALVEKRINEEQEKLNKLPLHYHPSEFTNVGDMPTCEDTNVIFKQIKFEYGNGNLFMNIDYTINLPSGKVEKHFAIYETTVFDNVLNNKDYRYLIDDLNEIQDIFNTDIEIRCNKH